jgi:hypothetical protein
VLVRDRDEFIERILGRTPAQPDQDSLGEIERSSRLQHRVSTKSGPVADQLTVEHNASLSLRSAGIKRTVRDVTELEVRKIEMQRRCGLGYGSLDDAY